MQVLPTDAFDDEQLESLTANLTSKQIGWLQAKAADQDVSVDHVLRSVLTAQMQQETQSLSEPSRGRRGDGAAAPSSQSESSSAPSRASSAPATADRDASSPGRDADDLAESAQDTLDRLRSRLGRTSGDDDASLTENQTPSMFDMMEDAED